MHIPGGAAQTRQYIYSRFQPLPWRGGSAAELKYIYIHS